MFVIFTLLQKCIIMYIDNVAMYINMHNSACVFVQYQKLSLSLSCSSGVSHSSFLNLLLILNGSSRMTNLYSHFCAAGYGIKYTQ